MFFQWYRYCFSKYFTFQGRASRTEYWSFTIINLLILMTWNPFAPNEIEGAK